MRWVVWVDFVNVVHSFIIILNQRQAAGIEKVGMECGSLLPRIREITSGKPLESKTDVEETLWD